MIQFEKLVSNMFDAIEKYSSEGDNSLEYIGISVENNLIENFRIYRRIPHGKKTLENIPECVDDFITEIKKENPCLSFCDYSYRGYLDKHYVYSISFEINTKNSLVESEMSDTKKRISETFCKRKDPCIQIGYLVDESKNILEKKIYYSLNDDGMVYTREKRIARLVKLRDKILDFMMDTYESSDKTFSEKLFDCSYNYGYRLFMMGSNFSNEYKHNKLYFMYDHDKDLKVQLEKSLLFAESLICSDIVKKLILKCSKCKLLLKGYACEIRDKKPMWRLYFWQY